MRAATPTSVHGTGIPHGGPEDESAHSPTRTIVRGRHVATENIELKFASTSRRIRTPDWDIHYHDAGAGAPVVLLHGSGPGASGWSNFAPNIAALAANFRVLAVDVPGWGESQAVDPTRADSVGAVLQLLDSLDIDAAALVGNSMGGMIALAAAVHAPDRVTRVVTMGAPGPFEPSLFAPAGISEGFKVLLGGYHDPSPDRIRELVEIMTYDSSVASEETIRDRAAAAAHRDDHRANFLAGISREGFLPASTADQLMTITAPTLIVHGRDDRVVPIENALRLCALIPDSRAYLINRCGHWAQLEHADEFNRVVAGFLAP